MYARILQLSAKTKFLKIYMASKLKHLRASSVLSEQNSYNIRNWVILLEKRLKMDINQIIK